MIITTTAIASQWLAFKPAGVWLRPQVHIAALDSLPLRNRSLRAFARQEWETRSDRAG
jgi:hypothetical protein